MEIKYKIHAFYILLILCGIIILLITVKWVEIPSLVQYLTFALTVTSLVLAMLAIVYSFYSNTTFSQTIGTLNSVSKDVATSAKELNESTIALSRQVEAIPSRLLVMESKVEETKGILQQMSTKQVDVVKPTQKTLDEVAEGFLPRSSLSGLMIIYVCSVAHGKAKPFHLENLCKTLTIASDHKYLYGFLVATTSAGLLVTSYSEGVYTIKSINNKLAQAVKTHLEKRVDSEPTFKDDFPNDLKTIDSYFTT